MNQTPEGLKNIGLLPSVTLENAADILPLADALLKAGVPCVELPYLPMALEALKLLADKKPEFCAGVRVSSEQEEELALAAGAKFITGGGKSAVSEDVFGGGRFVPSAQAVNAKDWAEVTRQINRALLAFLDFNLRHVGINSKDESESLHTVSSFERIFGFPKEDRGGAYFAGDIIEVMKKPFYGRHGHIAVSTADAGCAARYLQARGVKLNWPSAGYNPDGRLRVVYLQDEIGGFAVHILQKQ